MEFQMRKEFEFNVKDHKIKVTNPWLHGAKLCVDGDFSDFIRAYLQMEKLHFYLLT
jgi:hypothetical protein